MGREDGRKEEGTGLPKSEIAEHRCGVHGVGVGNLVPTSSAGDGEAVASRPVLSLLRLKACGICDNYLHSKKLN